MSLRVGDKGPRAHGLHQGRKCFHPFIFEIACRQRREDVTRFLKQGGVGVFKTGTFLPGQWVPTQEKRLPSENFLRPPVDQALGTPHVSDQGSGHRAWFHLSDEVDDGAHRRGEDDEVGAPNRGSHVYRNLVQRASRQGTVQDLGFVKSNPNASIAMFAKRKSPGASDKADTNNRDAMEVISHWVHRLRRLETIENGKWKLETGLIRDSCGTFSDAIAFVMVTPPLTPGPSPARGEGRNKFTNYSPRSPRRARVSVSLRTGEGVLMDASKT